MPDEKPNNNGHENNVEKPPKRRRNPLLDLPKVPPPPEPDPRIVPLAIKGFYPRKKDAPYPNDKK